MEDIHVPFNKCVMYVNANLFLDSCQQHFTYFLINLVGKWYDGLGF